MAALAIDLGVDLAEFRERVAEKREQAIAREQAERSLSEFIRQGWRYADPDSYVHNWHIDAICEHLEAVSKGEIRRLIINIPPRSMKSISVAVMWPAWDWVQQPGRRFLFASYAQPLSIRDSLKCRRLIESPWYQANWSKRFRLTSDQNTKIRFDNDQQGYRLATSVDGSLTGEGADFIVVDDAHNVRDANSELIRETTLEWWDQAMSTRLNDPKTGAYVIVMQRVHEADLVGHILGRDVGWTHLCLPMRYDPAHRYLWARDPRKEKGELLWPERVGEEQVQQLEASLGPYGAAGQLQQIPTPAGGGILKAEWWQVWPNSMEWPSIRYVVSSFDTAYTEKTEGDWTACTVWGVFEREVVKEGSKDTETCLMLLDAWREHLAYPDLRERAAKHVKDRKPDVVLIEDKGTGISLRQDLQRMRIPVTPYNPLRADKVTRAHMVAPLLATKRVYVPESKRADLAGRPMSWAQEVIDEASSFPKGAHDDYVDTVTQALILLRDQSWIRIYPEEDYVHQERRGNPYG